MGVSRDYTTGNDGFAVPTLDREVRPVRETVRADATRRRQSLQTLRAPWREAEVRPPAQALAQAPVQAPAQAPVQAPVHSPVQPLRQPNIRRSSLSRLGSQQVVSTRGRRVARTPQEGQLFSKISTLAFIILVGGIGIAMWLSGMSTSQTFRIQELSAQESTLVNQLETLHRDLEHVRSAADVTRQAVDSHLGVPVQAGIIAVGEKGDITRLREAKPEVDPIIDVNGAVVRPSLPSSDPAGAREVAGAVSRVPVRAPYSH